MEDMEPPDFFPKPRNQFICDLGPLTLQAVKQAVRHYCRVAGNEHLGSRSPRQDIHDAFAYIRNYVARNGSTTAYAANELMRMAYSMEDM